MSIKAGEVWFNHRQAYLKANGETGISVRDFMELHDLNYNSGRRWFAKIQNLEQELGSDKEVLDSLVNAKRGRPSDKSDHIKKEVKPKSKKTSKASNTKASSKAGVAKKAGKKSDHIKSDNKKSDHIKSNPNKKQANTNDTKALRQSAQTGKGSAVSLQEKVITEKQRRLTIPQQTKYRDLSSDNQIGNGGRFQAGNAAAVYHGGYMDILNADEDIKAIVNDTGSNLNEIIKVENVRYLQMQRLLSNRVEYIRKLDAEDALPRDQDNNPIPADELIRDAYWGSSGQLTSIFATIAMASTQSMKAAIDVDTKYYKLMRDKEDRERVIEILSNWDRNDESITALSIAQEIELIGCKPPPTLNALVQKEIELLAPKLDDSGVSDEELDAMVASYQQELQADADKIVRNREEMKQLMAEAEARRIQGDLSEEDFEGEAYTGLEHFDDDAIGDEDFDEWDD